MKILIIGKYVPEVNITSKQNYNLANKLAEEGHKVFVVTDSWCCKSENMMCIEADEFKLINNKQIKLLSLDFLQIKMYGKESKTARLAGLAYEVCKKYDIDCIYASSIDPYGIAAYMVKKIIKKPLILSNFTYDLQYSLNDPYLKEYLKAILKEIDFIIGHDYQEKSYKSIGLKNFKEYVPIINTVESNNINYFEEIKINKEQPSILFLGNIKRKEDCRYCVNQLESIPRNSNLIISVYGKGADLFKKLIKQSKINKNSYLISPLSPWRENNLIKNSDMVIDVSVLIRNMYFDLNSTLNILSSGGIPLIDRTTEMYLNSKYNFLKSYIAIDNFTKDVETKVNSREFNQIKRSVDFKESIFNYTADAIKEVIR